MSGARAGVLTACCAVYGMIAVGAVALGLARQTSVLTIAGLALCAVPALVAVLVRAPQYLLAPVGLILGFMPFAALPGTGVQLVVIFSLVPMLVCLLHPTHERPRLGGIGGLTIVYLAVCAVSALATFTDSHSLIEYAKWGLATATALWALLLRRDLRVALMRAFVVGAVAGVIFTAAMLVVDRSGSWVDRFGFLGYGGSAAVNARTAEVGGAEVLRAAGLYVDPNSAGLFFLFAAGIGFAVYSGASRVLSVGILSAGIVMTLSRSAIASLLLAAVVLLLGSRLSAGRRMLLTLAAAVTAAVLLLVPAVSSRLLGSFSGDDVGADARVDALSRYPGQMSGAWLFGRGWYLREFYDPIYGYEVNHAANTPLIVVYRAGLVAGIVFVVLLAVAAVIALRASRAGVAGAGGASGVLVGLILVAFQLDFPVVTMPALAMAFALLLAEVQALARSVRPAPDSRRTAAAATPDGILGAIRPLPVGGVA